MHVTSHETLWHIAVKLKYKKHQNLNTNSGFIETMHFVVKFHDIYFIVFRLFIAEKLWSSLLVVISNIPVNVHS